MSNDQLLYHYTSIVGLNNIVRTGKVWASDCRYLNDRQELARALEMFIAKFEGATKEALSWALHWHNHSRCHCGFSLSRSSEVLSQWRSYADNGRGAAIGFRAEYLSGLAKSTTKFLVECVYENHDGFIDSLIDRCEQEIEDLRKLHEDVRAVNSFWEELDKNPKPLEKLYSELLKVKNPAFLEEQEVRLVINVPANMVQTRVANGLIIPYVEHEFIEEYERKSHLWCVAPEIWLGPKCDERKMNALYVFQQFGWQYKRYDCGYV